VDAKASRRKGEVSVDDVIFVGLAVVFFAFSWGFVRLTEKL
jgi:hypothetical protein